MRVYALLSWYDERPEHLQRCVKSLAGFADVLVGCDGAYATFPDAKAESPSPQHWALSDAVQSAGLKPYLTTPLQPWASEVEKRAAMFEYGRRAGATPEDWFLIIDADMELASFTPEARELLAATDRNAAEVRWHDVMVNEMPCSTQRFRSMFRALPGLTVERAHYLYTVDCERCEGDGGYSEMAPCTTYDKDCGCHERVITDPCPDCKGTGRRFLWHLPTGHPSDEPLLDLYEHVTLHHFNSSRDPERKQRAIDYYQDRDRRGLEAVGRDWTGLGELS